MWTNIRILTTKHFFKGVVQLSKGINVLVWLMGNAEKWRAKIMKRGRCQLAIGQLVLPALSFQLSFSKLCIMNTLLHFLLLLCQSCRSLRTVSFGGRILGVIKCAYHGWVWWLHPFKSCLGPPILNPLRWLKDSWVWKPQWADTHLTTFILHKLKRNTEENRRLEIQKARLWLNTY